MKAEDVAAYLKEHPAFFEEHAYVLVDVSLPHPHGGRAISISERQVLTLRDKIKLLESKLAELVQFGEENDAIGEKVHRISLVLLQARDLDGVLDAAYFNMREDFAVPHVAIRLWGSAGAGDRPEFAAVAEELKTFVSGLKHPHCGPHAPEGVTGWFGEARDHLRSFAVVALGGEAPFGVLVLASEDPERFYPEMGTLYLKRLGELLSAALMRHFSGE
jgi:uncharacterized protein YigA (DUF484 family)